MIREPHFDDERTLRAARRVVPLTIVNRRAKARSAFHLFYALLISAFLGAAVALLTSNLELRSALREANNKNATSVSDNLQQESVAVAPTPEVNNDSIEVASSQLSNDPAPVGSTTRSQPPVVARSRRVVQLPSVSTDDVFQRDSDELSSQSDSRWEERRSRRALRRELRRARSENNDELFRIREIFEGKRPQ